MDPVDPAESVESVDPVARVDLCGFYSNLLLTVCLGIQVEESSMSPCSGYKQVFFSFFQAWYT
jgi:hypothetical protein